MKTVILALFVLVVVSQSEALRCNCGGQKICSSPVETCYGSDMVCASVIIYAGSSGATVVVSLLEAGGSRSVVTEGPTYFKGCSTSRNCMMMNHAGISSAYCCTGDLCNR